MTRFAVRAGPRVRWAMLLMASPAMAADFSMAPRARLQIDSVSVFRDGAAALREIDARRLRLGAEGELPGALRYRVDVELSRSPAFADAWIRRGFGPATVTLGQQRTLNGLEQISSSVSGMFLERAAFTEAMDNPRRLGGAAAIRLAPRLRLDVGVFGQPIATGSSPRLRIAAARLVATPRIGAVLLHLGANGQRRDVTADDPTVRYRARPYTHLLSQRFVATAAMPAKGDSLIGVEGAAIGGRMWLVAEAQRAFVRGGDGRAAPWGGYAEAGVFLTGERRAYADGAWGRTAPARPVGGGGFGSVAATVRIDHVDLGEGPRDGGRQTGVLGSIVWQPVGQVRIIAQAARAEVAGGPAPRPFTMVGLRAQLVY